MPVSKPKFRLPPLSEEHLNPAQRALLDSMRAGPRGMEAQMYALRFHLHPSVRLRRLRDGAIVFCLLPNGRRWLFEASSAATVEESIFFAAPDGPRASAQIVVSGETLDGLEIEWTFRAVARKR